MADDAKNKKAAPQGFGITTDTKDSNNISILPPQETEPSKTFPSGYKFPLANLVNVVAKEEFETKNGKTDVLQFVFKDSKGRQYIHTEWKQDITDAKYDIKMEGLNSRVKHIYMQFFPEFPKEGIGTNASSFFDYFSQIADAFNANENLSKINVFLKLTYYKSNLGFPLSPNFIQRHIKDQPCLLEINLKYDKLKPTISGGSGGGIGAGIPSGGDTDIDFDEEYS